VVGGAGRPNHLRLVAGPLRSLASRLERFQALVKKVSEFLTLGLECFHLWGLRKGCGAAVRRNYVALSRERRDKSTTSTSFRDLILNGSNSVIK
jgi:hypothetical protein